MGCPTRKITARNWVFEIGRKGATGSVSEELLHSSGFQWSSSTCSTESTISLMSSRVTPGIMRSASVNARCSALRATRASWVDTRGNSCQ